MGVNHYENFPVGSVLLPRRLRRPVHAIYAFARTADDIADEGTLNDSARLEGLAALREELRRIEAGQEAHTALMQRLQEEAVRPFRLPVGYFLDLLSAFEQDVAVKRYRHFGELVDYSRRSANPIGRLLLHLYGHTDAKSLAQSDGICTALQLINFWQDVALDWDKGRVYLPQEDMAKYGVTEAHLAAHDANFGFQRLMHYECMRAFKMLKAGAPLGKTLKGRIGLELRLIVLGGQRILYKLERNRYDVFQHRPTLNAKDAALMLWHALKQS